MQALLDLSDKAKNLDRQKSQLLNRMQSRNLDKPAMSAQQLQAVEAPVTTPEQAAIQQVSLPVLPCPALLCCTYAPAVMA